MAKTKTYGISRVSKDSFYKFKEFQYAHHLRKNDDALQLLLELAERYEDDQGKESHESV